MATKTLYVGNLPYTITEGDLAQTFSAYGATNARVVEGRGFVDIESEQLEAAIADKNNSQLGGRTLTVNEARPRENRSNGGGGGGGGGGRSSYGGGGRNRW